MNASAKCEHCGKRPIVEWRKRSHYPLRFCSRKCAKRATVAKFWEAQEAKPKLVLHDRKCESCGKGPLIEWRKRKGREETLRFCSRKCAGFASGALGAKPARTLADLKCGTCGKRIRPRQWYARPRPEFAKSWTPRTLQKFCSRACAAVAKRGPLSQESRDSQRIWIGRSPLSGPYETNVHAKSWRFRSPSGDVIQCRNLAKFLRDNPGLFDPEDLIIRKARKAQWNCLAYSGLQSLRPRPESRFVKGSWKGWTWDHSYERRYNDGRDLLDRDIAGAKQLGLDYADLESQAAHLRKHSPAPTPTNP